MGSVGMRKANVLVVGLDNSGKTSIITYFLPHKPFEVTPTVGFQTEKFKRNNFIFSSYDMSGQSKCRAIWEKYYAEANAVIFVIDSSDALRVPVAKHELDLMLEHEEIKNKKIPILFFANKMDIVGSLTVSEVSKRLDLPAINNRPWNIFSSNAMNGSGIEEGFKWLSSNLSIIKKK